MRLLWTFALLTLSGCAFWGDEISLVPLPEKATTDGLTLAERELDAATDIRLNKIGASVRNVGDIIGEDTPAGRAAKWELEIAAGLTPEPPLADIKESENRIEAFKNGGDEADKVWEEARQFMVGLQKQIADADLKYLTEKAKKQAEFDAKLAQREQEIAREKELRKVESELAQKEKVSTIFTIVGAVLFVAGIAFFPLSKYLGMSPLWGAVITGGGIVAGTVPFFVNHEWFIYISGGAILVSCIGGWVVISRTSRCVKRNVRNPQADNIINKVDGAQ
jgi:F0F1-type ATP synthase assembly protein I